MSTTETPVLPMDRLAKTYRKIRDAKAVLTAEYETKIAGLDGQLEMVADAMKEQMKTAGVTSVRTDEGTVILSKQTRYNVQDWDAFKAFAVQHDALDLFERRIAQKNTEAFLEQNPNVAIPSLMSDAKYVVSVRKPGAKT